MHSTILWFHHHYMDTMNSKHVWKCIFIHFLYYKDQVNLFFILLNLKLSSIYTIDLFFLQSYLFGEDMNII
jgi:hypothetical protein